MSPLRSLLPWIKRGIIPTTLAVGLVLSNSGGAGAIPLVAGVIGTFEQDGNQAFNALPNALVDWRNVVPAPTVIPDTPSTGGGDTAIAGDDNNPAGLDCKPTGGGVPTKSDLLRAYLNTRIVNSQVFLDLAWVRALPPGQDPSANVVYEFNQNPTADPGVDHDGPCPIDRTEDDLLVTYDFGGNDSGAIRLWSWDDAGDEWDEMNVPVGAANGAVNTSPIDDFVFDNTGNTDLEALRFGEATINLTAAFTPPTGGPVSCETFGQTRVRSRTNGENFNALSDRLPAAGIHVSTCGSITIEKQVVGGPADVDFNFDPSANVNGDVDFTLGGGDSQTFPVLPGVPHTIVEDGAAPGDIDDYDTTIVCSGAGSSTANNATRTVEITVPTGENRTCEYTNTRQTGRLTINKVADPDSDDRFNLEIDGATAGTGGDVGNDGTTGPISLPTGSYDVGESAVAPADLANYDTTIDCENGSGGDEGSATDAGPLSVDLGEEDIICTITNTRQTGRLTVIKQLEPADDLGLFNLLINGQAGATDVGDEGSIPAQVVNTGVYTLTETAGTDTDLDDYTSSLECRDATDAIVPSLNGQVTIGDGDAIVCTFTNVAKPQAGTIIVKKVADEYDTGKDFPFSSDFDGNANDGTDFTLEAGDEQEFVLLAGTYSVKELVPTGWELVSAVCSDQSPATAIVLDAEEVVTCTFTNKKDDSYEQYPGDDDFDFVPPFVDPDPVPADPDPVTVVAGTTEVPSVQPAPQAVSPEAVSQPQPAEPIALDQLPRTGNGLDRVTMFGGIMLILGGTAVMAGRRRKAHQA